MLSKKIESERITFPNNNKRYSNTTSMVKSLSSNKNKNKYSNNLTQQNSAKRKGNLGSVQNDKIKRKNLLK